MLVNHELRQWLRFARFHNSSSKPSSAKAKDASSAYSYDNLRQLIEETMNLSRDALASGPAQQRGAVGETSPLAAGSARGSATKRSQNDASTMLA